jgi:hypothetical protein
MHSRKSANALLGITLLDLLSAIQDCTRSDREVVAAVADLLRRRIVMGESPAEVQSGH